MQQVRLLMVMLLGVVSISAQAAESTVCGETVCLLDECRLAAACIGTNGTECGYVAAPEDTPCTDLPGGVCQGGICSPPPNPCLDQADFVSCNTHNITEGHCVAGFCKQTVPEPVMLSNNGSIEFLLPRGANAQFTAGLETVTIFGEDGVQAHFDTLNEADTSLEAAIASTEADIASVNGLAGQANDGVASLELGLGDLSSANMATQADVLELESTTDTLAGAVEGVDTLATSLSTQLDAEKAKTLTLSTALSTAESKLDALQATTSTQLQSLQNGMTSAVSTVQKVAQCQLIGQVYSSVSDDCTPAPIALADFDVECTAERAGSLRYHTEGSDSRVQVCASSGKWVAIYEPPIGSSAEAPGRSCQQIKEERPTATDGFYYIKPTDSSTVEEVYCDQTTDNGGWTLVMRVSKNDGGIDFTHDGSGWAKTSYGSLANLDLSSQDSNNDYIATAYSTLPASDILMRESLGSNYNHAIMTTDHCLKGQTLYDVLRRRIQNNGAWVCCSNTDYLGTTASMSGYTDLVLNGDESATADYEPAKIALRKGCAGDSEVMQLGYTRSSQGDNEVYSQDGFWGSLKGMFVFVRQTDKDPRPGRSRTNPVNSCLAAVNADPSLRGHSGPYWIRHSNGAVTETWCDMTTANGGWTLVMRVSKLDGGIDFTHDGSGWAQASYRDFSSVDPGQQSTNQDFISAAYADLSASNILVRQYLVEGSTNNYGVYSTNNCLSNQALRTYTGQSPLSSGGRACCAISYMSGTPRHSGYDNLLLSGDESGDTEPARVAIRNSCSGDSESLQLGYTRSSHGDNEVYSQGNHWGNLQGVYILVR
eukprot:m.38947 g.38947  ORF g.38947 m.38947 type:complete len:822 (-) comp10264_c1_seq1:133-2598(-)